MSSALFWNDVALEVTRRDFTSEFRASPLQGGPTRTSRALAMVHLAMHDAYFGIAAAHPTYLSIKGMAVAAPAAGASADAALGAAAEAVLAALYNDAGMIAFICSKANEFSGTIPPAGMAAGRDYGMRVAQAILALRSDDGSDDTVAYTYSQAPGHHRPDPFDPGQNALGPHWGNVDTFTGTPAIGLLPPPGYTLGNYALDPAYAADFDEVKAFGALQSTVRTPDETTIGIYWGYDGAQKLGVPPRLYNQVARAWLMQHAAMNPMPAQLRLLTIVNVAMADAGIAAWHEKYKYDLWRPVVGIREASESTGPSATPGPVSSDTAGTIEGDPRWTPLGLPITNAPGKFGRTPGFPAYPSGHATFGAALFQVMQLFTGGPAITLGQVVAEEDTPAPADPLRSFSFVSDELDGKSVDADGSVRTRHLRQYTNFIDPIFENSISRVYLGVHWRFDGLPREAVVPPPPPGGGGGGGVGGPNHVGGVPLGLDIGNKTWAFFNSGSPAPVGAAALTPSPRSKGKRRRGT